MTQVRASMRGLEQKLRFSFIFLIQWKREFTIAVAFVFSNLFCIERQTRAARAQCTETAVAHSAQGTQSATSFQSILSLWSMETRYNSVPHLNRIAFNFFN